MIVFVVAGIVFVIRKAPGDRVEVGAAGVIAVTSVIVAFLLAGKDKRAPAGIVGFAGIAVWTLVFYTSFWIATDTNKYSRDFAKTIVTIIPKSDLLVAYKKVSIINVQYFGKTIPVVKDPNELYKYYERGDWIICRSNYLDELNGHEQLHEVCSQDKPSEKKKSGPGVSLYHQTAPGLPRAGALE
jgi:hypothetical protein